MFAAILVFVSLALLYWLIVSPFGTVLHAIRENKNRARFLGYDVNKFRVNAFVLSALFPAIAGWLWTFYQQSINPDASSVEYSGNVVMMSLLGGIQTFFGPILGAIGLLRTAEQHLADHEVLGSVDRHRVRGVRARRPARYHGHVRRHRATTASHALRRLLAHDARSTRSQKSCRRVDDSLARRVDAMSAVFSHRRPHASLLRLHGRQRRLDRDPRGRRAHDHRPERRGQDDVLQLAQRHAAAE